MAILVWVDLRLLAVALVILPVVWLTHRTWISRIRPMYRDIRRTRRKIDAHSAAAFGGYAQQVELFANLFEIFGRARKFGRVGVRKGPGLLGLFESVVSESLGGLDLLLEVLDLPVGLGELSVECFKLGGVNSFDFGDRPPKVVRRFLAQDVERFPRDHLDA